MSGRGDILRKRKKCFYLQLDKTGMASQIKYVNFLVQVKIRVEKVDKDDEIVEIESEEDEDDDDEEPIHVEVHKAEKEKLGKESHPRLWRN